MQFPAVLFGVGVAVLTLAATVGAIPVLTNFPYHAFLDHGWALRVDALLNEGLVPTEDFAYSYGLLSLALHRAAFALFGPTPFVTAWLILLGMAAVGWGAWRLTNQLVTGLLGRVVVLATLPLVVCTALIPSPTHASEAALLLHALAEQGRGRLGRSLALATAAVLVKPALGYVFGLVVVVEIFTTSASGRGRWTRLLPAVGVAAVGLPLLAASFGVGPLLRTLWPGSGGKLYAELNCGFFFGVGREFWWPPAAGNPLRFYLTTPAGSWLLASAVLQLAAVFAVRHWKTDAGARAVVTMTACHAAFLAFGYATPGSWIYYPYLPYLGAAVALDGLPRWTGRDAARPLAVGVGVGIIAGAMSAVKALMLPMLLSGWLAPSVRGPETGGLHATPATAEAWADVWAKAATGRVFLLHVMGCGPELAPGLAGPSSWYLSRAMAPPVELERARAGIARSEWLVVPHNATALLSIPEFADALTDFDFAAPAHDGDTFRLLRRRPDRPAKP